MAPPVKLRVNPSICQIGDWVPAEFVPNWGMADYHLYEPPAAVGATPSAWNFKRVVRQFGAEHVAAWERIS